MSESLRLRALEALLGAAKRFAGGACGFQRGAGVAVGRGQRVLRLLQPVGAGAARGFRGFDLADQRLALLGENLRRVFQFGAVALGIDDALIERGDLIAGAVLPFDPAGLVGGERRQPALGQFGFAHDGLLLGLHLGELRALAGDIVAHAGEAGFEIGGGRKLGDGAFGLGLAGDGLVAAGDQARCAPPRGRTAARLAG